MPGVVQPVPTINVTIASISSFFDKTGLHLVHRLMKIRCQRLGGGWRAGCLSELRNRLELAYNPAVGSWGHEDDVMHGSVFAVNSLVPIENLQVVFGSVVQFDHVT